MCDSSLLGFAAEDSFPPDAWLECSFSAVLLGAPLTGRKEIKLLGTLLGAGPGGYVRFQVMGMIEGFLGLKFSIPGFFWVRKFGK